LSVTPHLANWALTLISGALTAAGILSVSDELIAGMKNQGVLYHGLQVLGGGSTLSGLMLGAIAVFVIDQKFMKASCFALGAAVLTFFGLMHGEKIGVGESPVVAISYLIVSIVFAACAKFAIVPVKAVADVHEISVESQPA
jgi:AGZA family xanthine/uracil permease-like MFS transporter